MKARDYIRLSQKKWFEEIRPFLLAKNLNVGSGLGYFSEYAKNCGLNITSLDVCIQPETINSTEVVIYDGLTMPFKDNSFECSVATYVLHHATDPKGLLREMKRVTSSRIVLVEETYTSLLGKIRLVILDFLVNLKANQKSNIHWNSYFNDRELRKNIEGEGWKIFHSVSIPKFGFNKILYVIDNIEI